MKSEVYRTLVLTKCKPITPGHSRTPPWGILALCTVEYKTSMMRNTNGGQCVCLKYYQDTARIHAACSFHTHPELLISIPAIHGLLNHTLWVLGPCTSIMLTALCVYHHAVYECMDAKDMPNIRAVSSSNMNTNENICTPYMPADTAPLIWCCS